MADIFVIKLDQHNLYLPYLFGSHEAAHNYREGPEFLADLAQAEINANPVVTSIEEWGGPMTVEELRTLAAERHDMKFIEKYP